MSRQLTRFTVVMSTVCILAFSPNGAFAENQAKADSGVSRSMPNEMPGSTISWDIFAWLPGRKASAIAANHLSSAQVVMTAGWGVYVRGLQAGSDNRPVSTQGATIQAYQRWLAGEVKPLPMPGETASYVGN